MNEASKNELRALGWSDERIERMNSGAATEGVDRRFLQSAHAALAAMGCGALELLDANPGVSILDLAKRVNHGISAIGLMMAIYEEAKRRSIVRETAKDLLIRTLCEEFPEGWSSEGSIHPVVRIGGWSYGIKRYVGDQAFTSFASDIVRHLAGGDPPPKGWKPIHRRDPLIEALFDRYWPIG
jgi:hypothetical protein